jgi:hypothetical protein
VTELVESSTDMTGKNKDSIGKYRTNIDLRNMKQSHETQEELSPQMSKESTNLQVDA